MKAMMICSFCGNEIEPEEKYELNGKNVCEDCYIEQSNPVTVCNPWSVLSANKQKETAGLTVEKLTDLQDSIYNFVKENQKVTMDQLCSQFNLSEVLIQNQLAVLRHLELIKGKMEENKRYVVIF